MIDQMQREVTLRANPQRIISLVPSISELLFHLGLDARIAGITRYCIHPNEKTQNKAKIGGTKKFRFEKIEKLQPDLIIGNKEENYQEGIARLAKDYPVWMSDISTLDDALNMILAVGTLTQTGQAAATLASEIETRFQNLPKATTAKAAYLIWKNPYMAVGGNTFINNMLAACGLVNLFEPRLRYPEIRQEDLFDADVILLSSEPYPFGQTDIDELHSAFPGKQVVLVDGTYFSWYGSRLLDTPDYFRNLQHTHDF